MVGIITLLLIFAILIGPMFVSLYRSKPDVDQLDPSKFEH